jgi:hypothetical protein
MSGTLWAPAALTPGKEPPEPVWTFWTTQKYIFLAVIRNPDRPALSLLTIPITSHSLSACNISNTRNINTNIHIDNGLLTRTFLLLRMWVRIPTEAWIFVCCECCVLSGRGLCDGLITRPEESYRLWSVVVCDQETSKTRKLRPATGLWKYNQNGL